MTLRQSVFSVVGEMDHGKTTLLDYLQHSSIQKHEFGGTTQIIRANSISLPFYNSSNQLDSFKCTFLDTPGQSCFSIVPPLLFSYFQIRENGSVLSDVALYVISLSEGPSSESHIIFNQLKANGVPVILVFTKSDLVSDERKESVRQTMLSLASEYSVPIGILFIDFSFLVESCVISSVTGEGMQHFQQRIVELGKQYQRSVPLDVPAEASILDSLLIPSQGIIFRALIQQGKLSIRDNFICGLYMGRVRNLIDLQSNPISQALPGMVVNVLGARKLPASLRKSSQMLPSGHTLFVRSPKEIEEIMEQRLLEHAFNATLCTTEEEEHTEDEMALENPGETEIINGEEYIELKKQPIIVVADNANSLNVILETLEKKPQFSIIRTRVGQILDHDIEQCKHSNMKIVSFNVDVPSNVHLGSNFIYSRLMSELLEALDE